MRNNYYKTPESFYVMLAEDDEDNCMLFKETLGEVNMNPGVVVIKSTTEDQIINLIKNQKMFL